MQLTCPCLNITINIVVAEDEEQEECFNESILKPDAVRLQFGEDVAGDPFFAGDIGQFILCSENGIIEKLPVLIRRRSLDNKLELRRCLVCDADAYALRPTANMTATGGGGGGCGQVLVNTKLFIRDKAVIDELRKSPEISPVFQVILPKKGTIPLSVDMNGYGYGNVGPPTALLSRSVLQSVQSCVSRYLTREEETMDDRIRAYIDQEQSAFERLKANSKAEKTNLLRLLAQKGPGGVGNDSSNSNSNLDDGFDSAVPLSPLSATSGGAGGDPSPRLIAGGAAASSMMMAPALGGSGAGIALEPVVMLQHSSLRPKALSNPASLTGWKRKRHSGGNTMAPSLESYAEEQQDIFTFDEQEALGGCVGAQAGLPIDADTNSDAITAFEDCTASIGNNIRDCSYPFVPPSQQSGAKFSTTNDGFFNSNHKNNNEGGSRSRHYGGGGVSSLPFYTPTAYDTSMMVEPEEMIMPALLGDNNETTLQLVGDAEEKSGGDGGGMDVGACMHAMALSTKCPDDPERLFGERPQRRRWKTGEDRQHQQQQQQHHFLQSSRPRNNSMHHQNNYHHNHAAATIIYAANENRKY